MDRDSSGRERIVTGFRGISSIELQREVEALQAEYVETIDDDRLEDWPELFTDRCLYRVIPRENADRGLPVATIFCDSKGMLIDRIVSLRKANIYPLHHYRHVLSAVRVKSVHDDVIHVQSNYAVFQTRNDGKTTVYNVGKYLDEIVRVEDALKFKSKSAIFDTNRVDTLMVRPI